MILKGSMVGLSSPFEEGLCRKSSSSGFPLRVAILRRFETESTPMANFAKYYTKYYLWGLVLGEGKLSREARKIAAHNAGLGIVVKIPATATTTRCKDTDTYT